MSVLQDDHSQHLALRPSCQLPEILGHTHDSNQALYRHHRQETSQYLLQRKPSFETENAHEREPTAR
jgi:hypothetical protein